MAPRICVVGSSNMDLIVRAVRVPEAGETVAGTEFLTSFGGKGGNQAVMAARLGAQVTMIGRVGSDLFGDQLIENYRRNRIDTTFIRRDRKQPTGVATIVVEESGQNRIIVVPGANAALSVTDVRTGAEAIRSADVLLCQLEVPIEATTEALKLPGHADRFTILNLAPYQSVPKEVFDHVSVVVLNETELGQMTTLRNRSDEALERAVDRLWNRLAVTFVVTLGERGVLTMGWAGPQWFEAVAVEAVDTAGAGDAFVGALAAGIGRMPWDLAVRRALALAALTVTRTGTQTSYPSRREARDWLRQHDLSRPG